MSPQEQAEVTKVFRRALLVRVLVAVALHFFAKEVFFAPDQETYDFYGAAVARYWAGEVAAPPSVVVLAGPKAYYYIVGLLYLIFGQWPLVPKLVNAAIGAVTVRLLFDLALSVSGSQTIALQAARLAAYFPSLVLWSALNLRDGWIVFLIVLVCRQAMRLQQRFDTRTLAVLLVAIFSLPAFRPYIFWAIATPLLVSFLVRRREHFGRNLVLGCLVAVAVIYSDHAAGQQKVESINLEVLQEYREYTRFGGSKYAESVDISTPLKAVAFLPEGIAFFLLAPLPWQVVNLRQAFTTPEMLFFYWLLVPIFRGLKECALHRMGATLMILLITGGLTLGYSLGQANAGTAYRYRAQVLPFYLMFAAIGLEKRRRVPAEVGAALARGAA